MSNREFDDIIKQKAQRRQADVPPSIWEGIAEKKKKRRTPFFWLIFFALLAGSGIGIWQIKKSGNDKTIIANQSVNENKNSKSKTEESVVMDKETSDNNLTSLNKTEDGKTGNTKNDQTIQASVDKKTNYKLIAAESITSSAVINSKNNKPFLPSKQKKNIKGRYNVTLQNGEFDEIIPDKEKDNTNINATITPQKINDDTNKEPLQDNDNLQSDQSVSVANNNKTVEPIINTADSTETKTTLQPVNNIIDKKETKIADNKQKKKSKSKSLSIEAGITTVFPTQQYDEPLYVQRILNTINNSASFRSDNIATTIESGSGFSINLVKKLNSKWSIGAGINYLRMTERLQIQGSETNAEFSIVQRLKEGPNGPYLGPDTVSNITSYNTTLFGRNIYQNVGLPVFARYRFIRGKKLSCELSTGFTVNFIRKYKNNIPGQFTTVYSDGSKQNYNSNSIGIDISAGLFFCGRLYRKYEWFAAPSFTYNLSAYRTASLSLNKKINMPGITVGVRYELKR